MLQDVLNEAMDSMARDVAVSPFGFQFCDAIDCSISGTVSFHLMTLWQEIDCSSLEILGSTENQVSVSQRTDLGMRKEGDSGAAAATEMAAPADERGSNEDDDGCEAIDLFAGNEEVAAALGCSEEDLVSLPSAPVEKITDPWLISQVGSVLIDFSHGGGGAVSYRCLI